MNKCTRFLSRAGLAAFGQWMTEEQIWAEVENKVVIGQKVIQHKPHEKLLDAFINIVAGGKGVVEVNTRVRSEEALGLAFGREKCAEQSTVSRTLSACQEASVVGMRAVVERLLRRYGQAYQHDYRTQWQLLDVDMSGLPAGRQGEQVTKGYFGGHRSRRGRQLGRVLATHYDEILVDRLYPGTKQLDQSLPELVEAAFQVLEMTAEQKQKTIVRVDGGGGKDADVNWLLKQGLGVLVKVHNWKRAQKLAGFVESWYPDPKVPERQLGWCTRPHSYVKTTYQIVERSLNKKNQWHYRVVVTNLPTEVLFRLARQPLRQHPSQQQLMIAIAHAYDLRGGAAETSLRNSKQGLSIVKRNKRSFHAQEMLILLAQLAYNLLTCFRSLLAQLVPLWASYGILRLIRDGFHISGFVELGSDNRISALAFNQTHLLAKQFVRAFQPFKPHDLSLYLRKI